VKGRVTGAEVGVEVYPASFGFLVEEAGSGYLEAEVVADVAVYGFEERRNRSVGAGELLSIVQVDVFAVPGKSFQPGEEGTACGVTYGNGTQASCSADAAPPSSRALDSRPPVARYA